MAKWSWGDWKPEDYEGFNKDLNGVPDKLVAKYDPEKYKNRQSFGLAGLAPLAGTAASSAGLAPIAASLAVPAAAAYGVGKLVAPEWTEQKAKKITDWIKSKIQRGEEIGSAYEVGMGETIPGAKFIEKKLPSEWKQRLSKIKEQSPLATKAGTVAGTVGQMALPGAHIVKGAGVLPMAANAALNIAPYAVGEGLTEYAETGDVGKAVKKGLVSEATGTAMGAAGGVLAKTLSSHFPTFGKWLKRGMTDTAIREVMDIDPKAYRATLSMKGKIKDAGVLRKRGQDLSEGLLNLMNEEGIKSRPAREAWIAAQDAKWKVIDQAFDASGKKVSDFTQDIMGDPTIAAIIEENGEIGEKIVTDLINTADKKANLPEIRKYLEKMVTFGRAASTGIEKEKGSAAQSIRNIIDAAFVPPQLKKDYGKMVAIEEALKNEEFKLKRPFAGGSQTAGRMMASGLAGGIGFGATGVNTDDPEWLKKSLGRTAGGFVAGSLLPRAGVAIANEALGRLSAKLAPLMKNIPQMSGKIAEKVPGLVARTVGMARQAVPGEMAEDKPEVPTQGTLESPASETAIPPENKEAAKEQVNTAWADEIRDRLNGLYDAYLSPYSDEMSREDFIAEIAKVTNNFDPHMTAGAIFPDKQAREAYLKSYDTALKLKGVDFGQALTRAPLGIDPTKNPILGAAVGASTEAQMAADRLKDIVVQHVTETGKPPSQTVIRQISTDIDGIAGLRVSPATKRRVLQEHLANYGIDYAQLARYGLVQGLT